VQAVALAHDLLTNKAGVGTVDFDDYLRSLCANIDPKRPGLNIEVDAERAQIPLDRAVPAGLIVNELVTNSIKYAFGNESGNIWVRFRVQANASEVCLTIEDDGRGMELPPKKGLGLMFVERFAHQIHGRLDFMKVDSGSRTVICFPVAF
jgi:two-component sensor histidine kinase